MDQSFTAGIGNLYSDEMLYQAGLRYDRPADSLSATEVRRLYRAIVETLADAIKHRGSSLADEQYRDLFGELGDFQGSHQVYDREGSPAGAAATPSSGSRPAAARPSSASTARFRLHARCRHPVGSP